MNAPERPQKFVGKRECSSDLCLRSLFDASLMGDVSS